MKYKVKLDYPNILVIDGMEYMLFPEKEIELPETAEIVQTYVGLEYLEPLITDDTPKKSKKEVNNAG
ncbi:hypothetical protein [Sulfurihydrogenibium sp.]|uniref:hypothetical protein n=1 Tax=Sulfurihydrogenibium sp. TaxID=2053621 RepID=UPI002626FB40|nr:hypothetical protein [Sulfurihydrogenibium sp.]